MNYLNNQQDKPIFELGRKERYHPKQAVDALLRKAPHVKKCDRQPLGVRQNMSFLIDISKMSNWEDIKADRNGVYNGVLRCGVWTVACEVDQNGTSFEIITKKKETMMLVCYSTIFPQEMTP